MGSFAENIFNEPVEMFEFVLKKSLGGVSRILVDMPVLIHSSVFMHRRPNVTNLNSNV